MRIVIMLLFILPVGMSPFATTSHAQIRFGIKAGLNTVDIEKEEIRIFDQDGREYLRMAIDEANYGINFGLYLLAMSKRFYFQPEVIYNSNTTDFKLDTLGNIGGYLDQTFQEKYQNLDIPLMFGLRFDFLRIGAGPVGHVHLGSTSDLFDFEGYEQDFENLTLGYQAGFGIDLWAINIDLRYEGNFTSYGDHFRFFGNEIPFSDTPNRFIGTIGISF